MLYQVTNVVKIIDASKVDILLKIIGSVEFFYYLFFFKIKYRKKEHPEESPKQQNCKCCRLGLVEPFHGK